MEYGFSQATKLTGGSCGVAKINLKTQTSTLLSTENICINIFRKL